MCTDQGGYNVITIHLQWQPIRGSSNEWMIDLLSYILLLLSLLQANAFIHRCRLLHHELVAAKCVVAGESILRLHPMTAISPYTTQIWMLGLMMMCSSVSLVFYPVHLVGAGDGHYLSCWGCCFVASYIVFAGTSAADAHVWSLLFICLTLPCSSCYLAATWSIVMIPSFTNAPP